MTAYLSPAIFPKLIEHFPKYSVLYCHACKRVYFPYQLETHLQHVYHVAKKYRQLVVEYCQTLLVAVAPDDLDLGRDDSSPVPFLPVLDGFACSLCRCYSWNWKAMREHINKAHQLF
jgi:hypothetical protein